MHAPLLLGPFADCRATADELELLMVAGWSDAAVTAAADATYSASSIKSTLVRSESECFDVRRQIANTLVAFMMTDDAERSINAPTVLS